MNTRRDVSSVSRSDGLATSTPESRDRDSGETRREDLRTCLRSGPVGHAAKGETLPNFVTGGYDKGYIRSSPFAAGANPAAINAATAALQAMKKGDAIFVGPLNDNTGKRVIPAGTTYGPYADELQRTNYLLEGVIGSIA